MSTSRTIAVFADFDDTLATSNVARHILGMFAPEALAQISAEYRADQITFREYQERCFDAANVPIEEMQSAAADSTELRSGLPELLDAVRSANGSFTVVSAGLDFYISAVLERNGYGSLKVVSGTARRRTDEMAGLRYDYPFANEIDRQCRGDWATCKCRALKQAEANATTVFVGDGSTSDACAAANADHVFARDRLLAVCERDGIAAMPFDDLLPVAEFVNKLAASTISTQQQSNTKNR